ncbi:hypothetical protein BYT27DRAFT_7213532 [Phlegmacium glaucopus]|nr:hypothetical protein BYT27DRAFT_7213532 [Phlegmacium glaucopus]
MPLVPDDVYAIRNDLTHTVLDFTGNENRNLFVLGWGWHGGDNQRWKLIRVGDAAQNKWKIQNQQNQARYLCPQLEDAQPNDSEHRLAGGIVQCVFVIEPFADKYRILYDDDLAVALVTGQELHNIQDRDRVLDIHADGPPVALQARDNANRAQIWSFLTAPVAPPLQNVAQTLQNGAYKIVNSQTGTVLDVADTVVLGLVSKGGDHHKWIITRDGNRDLYTLRSSTILNHFLAPDIKVAQGDLPQNGTALIGRIVNVAQPVTRFTIRKVPGTLLYKIFLDPLAPTENVSGLAVNLPVVSGAPDSFNGAIASLQATNAQKWHFVSVPN